MEVYTKMVPIEFVTLGDKEFTLSDLMCALVEMSDTEENDTYGDHSLRDYELNNSSCTKALVDMGIVKFYVGSRMAHLYCSANDKAINDMKDEIYAHWDKKEAEKEQSNKE